uniref:Uncharacterized protein n=1 Tax=Anguilla anguilla TaxID=7936 RepID=A0A0E9PN53_ANGAN
MSHAGRSSFMKFHRAICDIMFVHKNGEFSDYGRADGHMYLGLHFKVLLFPSRIYDRYLCCGACSQKRA